MAKTYSELLVVIAQRDLTLAKLRLQIEKDSREFHETYTNNLESHKRDLARMASEYSESLAEKQSTLEYWISEAVKARSERDSLYSKLEREKEETKLALQRVERLKKRLFETSPETLEDSPLTGGDSPETLEDSV